MSLAPFHEYMDLIKELYAVIGYNIRIKVKGYESIGMGMKFREFEFEGIVEDVYPSPNYVRIHSLYLLPDRTFGNCMNFFFKDIESFSVVETPEQVKKRKYDNFNPVQDLINRILSGESFGHTEKMNYLCYDLDDDKSVQDDEDVPYPEDLEIDDFVLDLPLEFRHKLPSDNAIIDAVNLDFNLAIKHISQQKIIGVGFEGHKISRLGKLAWVCISTPCCVFMFDIVQLGTDCFDEGLRQIFQNQNIEKVIHDCRQPSDCLVHLFDTKLVNVFDTQVADYIVTRQTHSDKPAIKHVSSLDQCLINHLDVPLNYIGNRVDSNFDEMFYRVRPVCNDYRDVMIKNAVYLCLLKEKLSELMFDSFHKAVGVYSNVLTNASESELLLEPSVPDMIPPVLGMQGLQAVRFVEATEFPLVPLVCKFRDPQKGTFVEMNEDDATDSADVEHALNIDRELPKQRYVRKNITESSRIDSQRTVIVHKICTNSMRHIDNVYHRLVNNLHASNISDVDIKPSKESVTTFVVKNSSFASALSQTGPVNSKYEFHEDKNFKSDLGKCKSLSYETLSGSSSDVSVDSSSESSTCDIWAKLRSDSSDSSYVEPTRRKIRFVPAGMYN